MREEELIIYKEFADGDILRDVVWLMEHYRSGDGRARPLFYRCMHRLSEQAADHGFYGNLWHCYLTNLLVNNENSYSCACEMRGEVEGSINELVLHDIAIFKEFFEYDFTEMMVVLKAPEFAVVLAYEGPSADSKIYNRRIRDRICTLAQHLVKNDSAAAMKATLTQFYREYGVGELGLHKAFRVEHTEEGARIVPIRNIAHVYLDDLVGYEIPKQKLRENTEAFVEGMETIRENYPPFAFWSAMNSLDTHDTPRILTLLGAGGDYRDKSKEWRARFKLSSKQRRKGKALFRAAALLLFLLGASLANAWCAQSVTDGIGEQLRQAQALTLEDNWDRAQDLTRQAYRDWQEKHFYFHTIMRHSDTDQILRAFRTVLEYLKLQEPDQYNAANADLIAQLELLAEMEQATVVNVL